MPSNLELKAPIRSIKQAAAIARRLGARDEGVLRQEDIYYNVPSGRLKLRIIDRTRAELIAYIRPDKKGGRYSKYSVLPVRDLKITKALLNEMFGARKVVKKARRLFLYKNARIHLDDVRGIGQFIEFEVLVQRGKRQSRQLYDELVDAFGIQAEQEIKGSYGD